MKYRNVELYSGQALDNEGTKIIDLRTSDPISAIRLAFIGQNGSSYCKDYRLNDVITKIELVDGSDQLLSMTLKEAQALEFRRIGKMPYMRPGEEENGLQRESTLLLFGRYLWDPEYYMDLSKFRNPQLKITSSLAAGGGVAVTAWATGSLKVTIDLLTIQEGAEPAKGFMMAKNIYGFTSATSGDEHVDMPMDYPYVGLLIRAFVAGNDVNENISKLKINCDAGKFIPIEKLVYDIFMAEEQDLGPVELRYVIHRKSGETVTHDLNHDPQVFLTPNTIGHIAVSSWSWSSRFALQLCDAGGTPITTEENILLLVKGSCPHSTIHLPFGLRNQPATYFDPKVYGDIDLVLTQAAASAVGIVLEQLRPYGAAA